MGEQNGSDTNTPKVLLGVRRVAQVTSCCLQAVTRKIIRMSIFVMLFDNWKLVGRKNVLTHYDNWNTANVSDF